MYPVRLLLPLALVLVSACGAVEDVAPPTTIAVAGEVDSGLAQPTWTWDTPGGVAEVRVVAVDGGAEKESAFLSASSTRWTVTVPLDAGRYRFEVRARDDEDRWFAEGQFDTTVTFHPGTGIWRGVKRARHISDLGREVVVTCPSCYDSSRTSSDDNRIATLAKIHAAQAGGLDAIELPITSQGDTWYVDPRDSSQRTGALLASVLDDDLVRSGDQLLILDIAETVLVDSDVQALLELLASSGYLVNGRPLILRAPATLIGETLTLPTALDRIAAAATADAYPFHHAYLRYHVTYPSSAPLAALHASVAEVVAREWHAVELEVGTPSVAGPLAFARSQELGVGARGVGTRAMCAALRDWVDLLAPSSEADRCARAIGAPNLVQFDTADQNPAADQLSYMLGDEPRTLPVTGAGQTPSLQRDKLGEDRSGSSLFFVADENDVLELGDLVIPAGIVLSAVVNFDTRTLAAPQTGEAVAALVSKKAGTTGFALEMVRPAGSPATLLRFQVFVGGKPFAATAQALFTDTDSYLVVASYDGAGAAHLWIDGVAGTPSAEATGAIDASGVPVALGAQPGAVATTRWAGKIQMVSVSEWPSP